MEEMTVAQVRRIGPCKMTGQIIIHCSQGRIKAVEANKVILVAEGSHVMDLVPGIGNVLVERGHAGLSAP